MTRRRRTLNIKKRKSKARAAQSDIVVLFADVVGCSEISNNLKIKEYNDFINSFQKCFNRVCEHYKREEYDENEYDYFQAEARGDEGCLKIFVPSRRDLSRDIDITIRIALDLKRAWLFEKHNRDRIKNGLLPVDIGIGIHAGKVYVNKDKHKGGKVKHRPEGYAINLSKRIESESRRGNFSRIILSEQACGQLHNLKDEYTYRFDAPFAISPKGISRDMKVFEIKHHFLPTDWVDMPSEVSMIYDELNDDKVKISRQAYDINPMNLWLAEEYILLSVMNAYEKLHKKGQENDRAAIERAYAPALYVARHLANSNLRDAGVLALLGFILGEQNKYEDEQKMYLEGLKLDDQDELLHWYLGYSISCELDDDRKERKSKVKHFYAQMEDKIKRTLREFERAFELRPWNVWNVYDYACELAWWSKAEGAYRKKAVDMLLNAFTLNEDTMEQVKGEKYLKPIINDSRIQKCLGSQ